MPLRLGRLKMRSFWPLGAKSDDLDPDTMAGRVFDLTKKQRVSLDGYDIFVMPNDYVGASIATTKIYEPHVTALIRKELREDDVFLDVGANVGFFSLLASSLVPRGKVIGFEPNFQNLQLIYESMIVNKSANITIYPYAVSDAERMLRFKTIGSNGFIVNESSKIEGHSFFVQSVVLDKLLQTEPRIDVVKIDVEAHEPFVLRSMAGLLEKHRPTIFTEFFPFLMRECDAGDPRDYLRQLEQIGYSISVINPDGQLIDTGTPDAVFSYWDALGDERIHLDLLARPIDAGSTRPS